MILLELKMQDSDVILWKDNFYRITAEWDRREYGFRYDLEYLNRNPNA